VGILNDQVRQALCALVNEHGAAIATDPPRCESLLRERCPANKRELALLSGVLRSGVMDELLRPAAGAAAVGRLGTLARRIEDEMAVKGDPARWAVESWALALGWPLEVAKPVAPVAPVAPVRAPAPVSAPRTTPAPAPPSAAPAPAIVPPLVAPVPVPEAAPEPAPVPVPVAAPASIPRRGYGAWIAAAVLVALVVLYALRRLLMH
jgi:hypothetical protein